jgi:hypothetical protein
MKEKMPNVLARVKFTYDGCSARRAYRISAGREFIAHTASAYFTPQARPR